ncbi:MAG TPA: CoA-binding protein, partial [Dehalococcoidia bacterium]|nr:CoA-binding protein [Dehalococcoidia bacterium]
MATLKQAADDFLAQKRIAVVGVSRSSKEAANLVYRTLRSRGYEVFAVNPNADEVEGDRSYHDLASIPGNVDAALIATPSGLAETVVEECARAGITRVWMHRSFGEGSVSRAATELGREKGITVIEGGCPMMFLPGADIGHKCMRWMLGVT